jgi:organic radical activating enzyme
MRINHLESDDAMKKYFGPQSGIGDQRVYLAEQPFITIQGEGPNIGKNTLFVRFFGCNLANSCGVDWCDSKHSFYTNKEISTGEYPTKEDRLTFKDVNQMFEKVFMQNELGEFNNVVFTGGEPLLWQITIAELIRLIKDKYPRNVSIEIETNGTMTIETELIDWFRMVHFNISPKIHVLGKFPLISQLTSEHLCDRAETFDYFDHDDYILKFVYEGVETQEKLKLFFEKYIEVPKEKVYLMPEGITREVQLQKMASVAEYCVNNGYNFSARLHVLIWNEAKGV